MIEINEVFDDLDGRFDARLRRVFPSTKTAKSGDQEIVVTNVVATVEARFDFKTLERLYSPNFIAVEKRGGDDASYLIFEVVGVNPIHFQMLGMDGSMPTLLRREYLDTISDSWGKSQDTWIDMSAVPTYYSMKVEDGQPKFERSRMLPLAGAKVHLLSRKTVEDFLCYPKGETVGTMLGFELPLTVSLENLIRYHAGIFGFSVAPEEPIVYREGGRVRISKIGDLVDRYYSNGAQEGPVYTSEIEVVCFDQNTLEVRWAPLQYVFRHRYDKKMLRFRLRTGREVTVTPAHSLFVAREGKIISVPASEINIGDHLVGAREIPEASTSQDGAPVKLDLLSIFAGDAGVRLSGIPKELIPRGFLKGSNASREWRWRKNGMVPISYVGMLAPEARRCARITYKSFGRGLPQSLDVDSAFARLLGYYTAEGHASLDTGKKYAVDFTLGEKDTDIIADLCLIASSLGMKARVNPHGEHGVRVTIANKLLAKIMVELVGRGAKRKRVPEVILNSGPVVRRAFLAAWAKGDYGVTSSRLLMNDVMYLLLMEGCVATSTVWKPDGPVHVEGRKIEAGIHYQMKFPSVEEMAEGDFRKGRGRAEPIFPAAKLSSDLLGTYSHPSHVSKLKLRVGKSMVEEFETRVRRLPSYDGADTRGGNEALTDGYYRTDMGKYFVKEGTKTQATALLWRLPGQLAETKRIVQSDLAFFEVLDVKEVEAPGSFVYDVSVPGAENFMAGFGGVFCHNTGAGKSNLTSILIRKVMQAKKDITTVVIDVSGEYATHLIDILETDGRILSYEPLEDEEQLYNSQVIPESLEGTVGDDAVRGIFTSLMEKKLVQKLSFGAGSTALDLSALEELLKSTAEEGKSGAVVAKIALERLDRDFFRERGLRRNLKLSELDDGSKSELIKLLDDVRRSLNDRTSLHAEVKAIAEYVEQPNARGPEEEELTPEKLAWELVNDKAPRLNVLYLPEPTEARMIVSRLVRRLLSLRKKQGSKKKVLVVLDEAQEYIPGEPRDRDGTVNSNLAVESLLRQGRKYRIHCWLATQRVARLNVSALQQLHSYFVSTLPRFYDRMVISESFGLPLEVLERTAQLDTGEWVFVSYKATRRKNVPVFLRTENNETAVAQYLKSASAT